MTAYWEYAFTHQWAYAGKSVKLLGVTVQPSETLAGLAQQVCGSRTPWLACDSCIQLFKVDRDSSARLAKRFTDEIPEGWQQVTGPADYSKTLAAAKRAYQSVFKGVRDSGHTRVTTRSGKRPQRSGKQLTSSPNSSTETKPQAGANIRSSRGKRNKTKAAKCDFCGRELGEHEEIALLNERVVELMRTAGLVQNFVPPSVTDPSGQSRWVACSRCKERIPMKESQKKWWQFWQ